MSEPLPDVSPEIIDKVEAAATADGSITDPLATPSAPATDAPQEQAVSGAETQEGTTSAEDSFTKLDPNALPEELRPYYRSMQGDYTRSKQEIAPWRGLAEELGISSPDEVRQAAELYAYLQDPTNLRAFTEDLSRQLGIGQPSAATESSIDAGLTDDLDPDSAAALKPLQERIDQLEARLQERAQQEHAERVHWALLGEVTRQEAMLRDAHPEWQEADWDAVYDLAPAYEGDLVKTAAALEQFASHRVASFVNGKATTAATPGLQPVPPPRTAEVPREVNGEEDHELRGASSEAKAYLRNVLQNLE